MMINYYYPKNQVFYYHIKDLKIVISTYNKMKKQKLVLNISEVSSSDDESQAKPHKEDLKKYIKDSDNESTQEITPKSSPQKKKPKERKLIHPLPNPTKQSPKKYHKKISSQNQN